MKREVSLIVAIMAVLALSASGPAKGAGSVLAIADFNRPFDPVVIEGARLADILDSPLPKLRVMAFRKGRWDIIPFQVDEKKKFRKIGGVKNYIEYRGEPEYVTNAGKNVSRDDNPLFDSDDELVFMARDGGDRVARADWPGGVVKGVEIEISQEGGDAKIWAYGFLLDDPPALSSTRYIDYDQVKDEVRSEAYIVGYDKRDPLYFEKLAIPPSNGGSGVNMVDEEKFRVDIKVFQSFMRYTINNMDHYGVCFGAKVGPVRVIRRTRVKVEKFMFTGDYRLRDLFYYPEHFEYNLDISQYSRLRENIYDLDFRVTTDLSPDARGARITTDLNPGGAVADGATSDAEKSLNYGPTRWVAVESDQGRWIQQVVLPEKMGGKVWPDFYYLDDFSSLDPPERYPGQFGNSGFRINHLQHIAPGTQTLGVVYHFPPKVDENSISDARGMIQQPVSARVMDKKRVVRTPAGTIAQDTRVGDRAASAPLTAAEESEPTSGVFPNFMFDPNLGNGGGVGYTQRNFLGKGYNFDGFFLISDRMFFIGRAAISDWPPLPENKRNFMIEVEYRDHPNRTFFGVGNDTPEDNLSIYHWQQLFARLLYEKMMTDMYGFRVSAGIKNTEVGPGKFMDELTLQEAFGFPKDIIGKRLGATPYGIDGGWTNFANLTILRDSRDDWYNPHSGMFDELRIDYVGAALGADFDFVRIGLEARGYWSPQFINNATEYPNHAWMAKFVGPGKNRVFAARIAVDHIEADTVNFEGRRVKDVPFFEQSYIGDAFTNRGYLWARFLDNDRVYMNVEYRSVFWKIWLLVLFYDTGRVFDDITESKEWEKTTWDSYHHTVGFGFRVVLPAKLMMRLDMGFSDEAQGGIFYGEAQHTF